MGNYYSTALGDYLDNLFQAPFTGSTNTTLTNIQYNDTPLTYVTYSIGTKLANCGYQQAGVDISTILQPIAGEHLYTSPTNTSISYSFTVPNGVTSICILCIGGAGGPWNRCTQGNGSWFGGSSTSPIITAPGTVICYAGGGSGSGGGAGNGTEWFGNNSATNIPITQATSAVFFSGGAATGTPGGGGGAAGYAGIGGTGAATGLAAPAGGGGGGGSTSRSGGGVGVYGQGTSGIANGGGGSGGGSSSGTGATAVGGLYGGGFGGSPSWSGGGGALCYLNNYTVTPGGVYNITVGNGGGISNGTSSGIGGSGAVRIIWGSGRSFPSTNVTQYNQTLN
jgi:hypothetical protein